MGQLAPNRARWPNVLRWPPSYCCVVTQARGSKGTA